MKKESHLIDIYCMNPIVPYKNEIKVTERQFCDQFLKSGCGFSFLFFSSSFLSFPNGYIGAHKVVITLFHIEEFFGFLVTKYYLHEAQYS